jgi:hypothetical protein
MTELFHPDRQNVLNQFGARILKVCADQLIPALRGITGLFPRELSVTAMTHRDANDAENGAAPVIVNFGVGQTPSQDEIAQIHAFRSGALAQTVFRYVQELYTAEMASVIPEGVKSHVLFGGLCFTPSVTSRYESSHQVRVVQSDPWQWLDKSARIDPYADASALSGAVDAAIPRLYMALDDFVLGEVLPRLKTEGLGVPNTVMLQGKVGVDPAARNWKGNSSFRIGFPTKPQVPDEKLKALDKALMNDEFPRRLFDLAAATIDAEFMGQIQLLPPELQRKLIAFSFTTTAKISPSNLTE